MPFEYTVSDPRNGKSFTFNSPEQLSPDQQQRAIDKYIGTPQPPSPDANPGATDPGTPDAGSALDTARNVGSAIVRNAPGVALSAALPEAVAMPAVGSGALAVAKAMAARAGLSVIGQEIGQTFGTVATEKRMPTGTEAVVGGVLAGAPQIAIDAGGRAIFTPEASQALADQLHQTTRFTGAKAGEDLTLAGYHIKKVLPQANRTLNLEVARRYQAADAAAATANVAPIPAKTAPFVSAVQKAYDELGPAAASLAGGPESQARSVLQKILDRTTPAAKQSTVLNPQGQPYTQATQPPPLTYTDLSKMQRQLRRILPSFENRLNLPYDPSIIRNVYDQIDRAQQGMIAGTPAASKLIEAKRFFADEVPLFRKGLDGAISGSVEPSQVIDNMVLAKKQDSLAALYKNLDPETKNIISTSWFTKTMEKARDTGTGVYDPNVLLKEWDALGPKAQATLSQGRATQIRDIFDRLGTESRASGFVRGGASVTSGVGVVYGITKAADAFANGDPKKGFEYLAGSAALPYVLPHLLANKDMTTFLARGLKTPSGTNIAYRNGRLIAQTLRATAAEVIGAGTPDTIGPSLGPQDQSARILGTDRGSLQ